MEPAIVAEGLRRVFPGPAGEPVVAVDGVDFEVTPGEVFGLLGANGAGKSTTLRMLAALIPPTEGTARVCGHDVREAPLQVRARLGYLSATSGLPARLTCREVLSLFASLQGVEDSAGAAQAAALRFGVASFADRRVETLSTGMRQRVRIACAAVHEPRVLILDEPTAGLDVVAAEALLDDIEVLREVGASVVFSTHVLREAARVCDRIAVIHRGRIRAEGSTDGLLRQTGTSSLDEAFLALVRA